ncbi:MAG: hypothetical protein ABIP89_04580 [Polyangiaceae bacterium]
MTARTVLVLGLVFSLDPCSKLGINLKGGDPPAAESAAPQPAPLSVEETALADAKKLCTQGDFQYAHERLASTLPAGSPLRQSADFKDIENKWAAATTTGAADDPDLLGRRRALDEVSKSTSVDPSFQAKAKALLLSLPTQPTALPEIKSLDGGASSIEQARTLSARSDFDGVRKLLLPKPKLSKEEGTLLLNACKKLNDRACADSAKSKQK